ncbi:MAG: universal stress protein [Bacteroidota bacterium]
MKTLLVPVDFSAASHNAYLYARGMAHTMDAMLKVVHVFSGTFEPEAALILTAGMGRAASLQKQLDDFVQRFPEQQEGKLLTQLKVETEVIHGQTVASIVEQSKQADVEMVVIATTGQGDVIDRLLGSVSSAVAQKVERPVVLVPPSVQYQPYKRIMYASNLESTYEEAIQQLVQFNQIFNAAVHFVHVVEEGKIYEEISEEIFGRLFANNDPGFSFSLTSMYNSQSVLDALERYAEQNEMELLVLVNRQRGFLNNLLGNSMTKEMSKYTTIPLMVFHFTGFD